MASDVDLQFLDEFLLSEEAPDNGMGLSDLDGFLTGLLVGPELIMPSEWLPAVWGGETPEFASTEQARAVLRAIMGRSNEISAQLDRGPDGLEPIFWTSLDGEFLSAADWADGFLGAIKLRPESWQPLLADRTASIMLTPILALCVDEAGEPLLPLDEAELAQWRADVPDMIPTCVFAIREFWREYTDPLSHHEPFRRPPKVGRNDPCPCGSGRKYKRCCGAT